MLNTQTSHQVSSFVRGQMSGGRLPRHITPLLMGTSLSIYPQPVRRTSPPLAIATPSPFLQAPDVILAPH